MTLPKRGLDHSYPYFHAYPYDHGYAYDGGHHYAPLYLISFEGGDDDDVASPGQDG